MSAQAAPQPLKILILLFDGVNTLDVNGPLDVLCNYALREDPNAAAPFSITTAAKQGHVHAYEFISMEADLTFTSAKLAIQNGEFDIMLVPGSGPGYVNNLVNTKDEILEVISLFLNTDNKKPGKKWLVSICTGAILAGAAGAFHDRLATTHKAAISTLKTVCSTAGFPLRNDPFNDVPHRWVDGGLAPPAGGQKIATRILSSGGISCGLDACLWLIKETLDDGLTKAWATASMMDYNWNVLADPPKDQKITPAQKL